MMEVTENCCFYCCSSSQTILPDLAGCGKLGRDSEMMMMMMMILIDFVVAAVVGATWVFCGRFVAVTGEFAVSTVALRSFGDNPPEALQNLSTVFERLDQ
jgi:hypothetical protein